MGSYLPYLSYTFVIPSTTVFCCGIIRVCDSVQVHTFSSNIRACASVKGYTLSRNVHAHASKIIHARASAIALAFDSACLCAHVRASVSILACTPPSIHAHVGYSVCQSIVLSNMSINNGTCVVVMQELQCILNLHLPSVFLGNCYFCTMCGGFLCLDLSSNYILVLYQQCVSIMAPRLIYG